MKTQIIFIPPEEHASIFEQSINNALNKIYNEHPHALISDIKYCIDDTQDYSALIIYKY